MICTEQIKLKIMKDILSLARERFSARKFSTEPVSEEDLA